MIATGNYPQTVLDSVLENLNQAQQQIAVFQGQVKVQQDALLVVDRQMSYMRQQLSAACSAVTRTTITSEGARCE
ncbi:conjugal transfer pilus assembly protein TraH [Klebsiella pneumoniae]|uniref:Conjugal transfer pilus assembly protein TraH n=1 Tax=Klebsiella pneumoniae TaxID=573 RepID=A0AB74GZM1_KLEPN|nr:conjugal transfer pilus assembly protein TraH [Klebsiella pneumoniae]